MDRKIIFGWASNILNALIFIYIIIGTRQECFSKYQMILSAFGLIVSLLAQINSTISEE